LLLAGSILQVPFLFFPRLSLLIGSLGVLLIILDMRIWEPKGCGGFDVQPFQLGLSAQLLGIGFCHFKVFLPWFHRINRHQMPAHIQVWMGQRSLVIYFMHQLIFFPLAQALGVLLPTFGWSSGRRWCEAYDPIVAALLKLLED